MTFNFTTVVLSVPRRWLAILVTPPRRFLGANWNGSKRKQSMKLGSSSYGIWASSRRRKRGELASGIPCVLKKSTKKSTEASDLNYSQSNEEICWNGLA